jgi:hypothetical protein
VGAGKRRNIPIPDPLWELVQLMAAKDDISASAWVREACLARVMFRRGWEQEHEINEIFENAKREHQEEK